MATHMGIFDALAIDIFYHEVDIWLSAPKLKSQLILGMKNYQKLSKSLIPLSNSVSKSISLPGLATQCPNGES